MSSSARIFYKYEGGKKFGFLINRNELLDSTSDLDADAGKVAANVGLVAELIGEYSRRIAENDAAYRQWRGQVYGQLKADKTAKLTEEGIKQEVNSREDFFDFKRVDAELTGDLEYLRGLMDALRTKAQMITARTHLRRGKEWGESAGYDLRERPDNDSARVDAVRRSFAGGKDSE